jgi:hypothetical protein
LSINDSTDYAFTCLDYLVNVFFLFSSSMRVVGLLIRVKIERAFNRSLNLWEMFFSHDQLLAIMCVVCLVLGYSTHAGLWLRMFRLLIISSSVMVLFPRLNVLQVRDNLI